MTSHATAALGRPATTCDAASAGPGRLAWPVAMLVIGGLSAGLWAGICWLATTLF